MAGQPKARRRRKPKLSEKPEGWTGRYYAAYQDEEGKSQRKRFTRDYGESVHLCHLWLPEHLDEDVEIITVRARPDKAMVDTSLVAISTAYNEPQKRRVRGYDDQHHQGTINQQTADDIRRQISVIVDPAKKNLGSRQQHRSTSLENVFTPTTYKDMFLHFTRRWSQPYVNKIPTRFWSLIRFAAREPYSVRHGFTKDDVPSYGGKRRTARRT